jgi:hypothetical protein
LGNVYSLESVIQAVKYVTVEMIPEQKADAD